MPTIDLPHSRFIHIPKTGGTFVHSLIKESGIKIQWVLHKHSRICDIPKRNVPHFTVVRHPLTWWKSVYKNRIHNGWQIDLSGNETSCFSEIDQCRDNGFNRFINKIIDNNLQNLWFEKYCLDPIMNKILCLEKIRFSLYNALVEYQEIFDPWYIFTLNARNVSGGRPINYGKKTYNRLIKSLNRDYLRFCEYPIE
jgi:hypothetical protein